MTARKPDPMSTTERARRAAAARWADTEDRSAATAPARKAQRDRFATDADYRAYMARLADRALAARRVKRANP